MRITKKVFYFICVFVTFCPFLKNSAAQTPTRVQTILIDTDCATDDFRALCLFLAIKHIEILAITTSDGALSPHVGLQKIHKLLTSVERSEIKTAAGRDLHIPPPVWRTKCRGLSWGGKSPDNNSVQESAPQLIVRCLKKTAVKPIVIVLGSFTNLYDALRISPGIHNKIEKVLWYNRRINASEGANYLRDPEAAEDIFSQPLVIEVISKQQDTKSIFDTTLLAQIDRIQTPYATTISNAFHAPKYNQLLLTNHFTFLDDLLPVYFLRPELFSMEDRNSPKHSFCIGYQTRAVRSTMLSILEQTY